MQRTLSCRKSVRKKRKVLYDEYYGKGKEVVTGIVQRVMGKNVSINLGKADAVLSENEQVKGEEPSSRQRELKVYILEVKDTRKGTSYPGIQNSSGTCKTSL